MRIFVVRCLTWPGQSKQISLQTSIVSVKDLDYFGLEESGAVTLSAGWRCLGVDLLLSVVSDLGKVFTRANISAR